MSPWNYPFLLAVAPLAAAVAAGNCAIVKPSNYAPASSAILRLIISEVFDEGHVSVVEGGREENRSLLAQRFDYIFFTGSVAVGKVVMEAASANLTPVSLELGGKSPCIVDASADIVLAARRIVWGKFINAGQTCVAPDYILAEESIREKLIEALASNIRQFYGESPLESDDLAAAITEKHFGRILSLIPSGGTIICGGRSDPSTRKIEPVVIDRPLPDSPVMAEEIFGPVLPVLSFTDMEYVIDFIRCRPKPLALYLFTSDRKTEKNILSRVSFGGGCINDTIVHAGSRYLPFGGVGNSGMGRYHGKSGFDTFTHEKSILKKSSLIDIKLRYAPYKGKLKLLKKIL
jgi:aldehyde dehydrogenase (NAD+)